MGPFLNATLILVSILLIGIILLQVRGEGSGAFGQAQSTFRVRRGMELLLFRFTIGLIVLFVGLAILSARFHDL
ncbi:MAG: preprotein translocase subunit SecG [Chloroflexota bacterium]|nr:preprotein translocase subunit SecG [Chloroflexota bacterium]MDE2900869.1 preprotein translocase subunit SecG [Chloroflexota bacterium]MDE2968774.1 preprotein translocase subunit SecG [Chloroflexota bacterium]